MGIVGNKIKIRTPLYVPPCNADEGVYCTVVNQTFILLQKSLKKCAGFHLYPLNLFIFLIFLKLG